jgi:hypothetical protein
MGNRLLCRNYSSDKVIKRVKHGFQMVSLIYFYLSYFIYLAYKSVIFFKVQFFFLPELVYIFKSFFFLFLLFLPLFQIVFWEMTPKFNTFLSIGSSYCSNDILGYNMDVLLLILSKPHVLLVHVLLDLL